MNEWMKKMGAALLLSLASMGAEAVVHERDNDGRIGNWLGMTEEGISLGTSRQTRSLKEGFYCIEQAHEISATNSLGKKSESATQLLNRAEAVFVKMVDSVEVEPFARVGLAFVYAERGEGAKALACAEEGLSKHPDNVPLLCCRGRLLRLAGRVEDAIATFRKASSSTPSTKDAWLQLADTLLLAVRREEALLVCQEARKRWPDDEMTADQTLKTLLTAERFDEGLALCQSLINAHPQWMKLLYRRGQSFIGTGDAERALADFDAFLKKNPSSCEAYNEMGRAWSKLGNYENAHKCYRAGLRVHPLCTANLNNEGACYLAQKDYGKAAELLEQAHAINPFDARITSTLASAYLGKADPQAAFAVCTNAIAAMPWAWTMHFKACECLGVLGRREDALSYAEKGIAVAQNVAEAWYMYGNTQFKHGLMDKAFKAYVEAERLNPQDWRYAYYQAVIALHQKKVEEGVDLCKMALFRFPNNFDLLMLIVRGLEQMGRYPEALDYCARISALTPRTDYERVSLDLAKSKLEQARRRELRGKGVDATNSLPAAAYGGVGNTMDLGALKRLTANQLESDGHNPRVLTTWGFLAFKGFAAKEREDALELLLARGADHAGVRFWSGCLAMSLGRTAQAVTNWNEAIRLDPKMGGAYRELGKIQAQVNKNPQGALDLMKRAVDLEPEDVQSRSDLGYTYFLCGMPTNALKELEFAVSLDPSIGITWYNLGLVRIALNQTEEAAAAMQKASQAGYRVNPKLLQALEKPRAAKGSP